MAAPAQASAPVTASPAPVAPRPVVPEDVVDGSTQLRWTAAVLGVLQAIKLSHAIDGRSKRYLALHAALDAAFVALVHRLRIPRLSQLRSIAFILATVILLITDYIAFASWSIPRPSLSSISSPGGGSKSMAIAESRVRRRDVMDPSEHILGRHTVHVLPHATARLSPAKACFCISGDGSGPAVSIPLLFNNSKPAFVTYSITDFVSGQATSFNVTAHDLKHPSSGSTARRKDEEEDEDDEWAAIEAKYAPQAPLQKVELGATQRMHSLSIHKAGVVRLERVVDRKGHDVVVSGVQALIVECPRVSFSGSAASTVDRCEGDEETLSIKIEGMAPLEVKYTHQNGGKAPQSQLLQDIGPPSFSSPFQLDESSRAVAIAARAHDWSWAARQSIDFQLNTALTPAGRHTFSLGRVVDGCGNFWDPPNVPRAQRSFHAHAPAAVEFIDCSADTPLALTKGGRSQLGLRLRRAAGENTPALATVRFMREGSTQSTTRKVSFAGHEHRASISATEPGTYELVDLVSDPGCSGVVQSPAICTVALVPEPTIQVSFTKETDECAGEIGARAEVALAGTGPFVVYYRVSIDGRQGQTERKLIQSGTRGEIVVKPNRAGSFTLELLTFDDAHYKHVQIPGPRSISSVVHPLASARITDVLTDEGQCEGNMAGVQVELQGVAPWTLSYDTLSGSSRKSYIEKDIKSSPHALRVPILATVAKQGGHFSVSLSHVVDGRKCKRPIKDAERVIPVHRVKPHAAFYADPARGRRIAVRNGESAHLPLRLTGNSIVYRGADGVERMSVGYEANSQIRVDAPGEYRLVSVNDKTCPGTVSSDVFVVEELRRPTLALGDVGLESSSQAQNGSFIRQAVCEGVYDAFEVLAAGSPPLRIAYDIEEKGHPSVQKVMTVALERNSIPLKTDSPGHRVYTFRQIGDAVYETGGRLLHSSKDVSHLRVEQDVLARPMVSFAASSKRTFCVGDELAPTGSGDLALKLEGRPPFAVDLEVRHGDSSHGARHTISDIRTHTWPIKMPTSFALPGSYDVVVRRVSDATGCDRTLDREVIRRVEVAEIASIAPTSPQTDHCVGDSLDFVLQGTAPWSVKCAYRVIVTLTHADEWRKDAKSKPDSRTIKSTSSSWSRLAKAPGIFSITSVGHTSNQCQSKVVDIVRHVHPLPTVRVRSTNKRGETDIRDGEQAEIVFEFTGTPPFAFSWQRTAAWDRSSSPTALETHTVTDIKTHLYSIFTAQEGTISATYVADRHCSFPPVGPLALVK